MIAISESRAGPVLAGTAPYRGERTCTDLGVDSLRVGAHGWPDGVESKKIAIITHSSASGLISPKAR